MPRFNLVVEKKRRKIVQDDPRLKKKHGAPKKKLKGFALAKEESAVEGVDVVETCFNDPDDA